MLGAESRVLKELGLTYALDWCADNQPFALTVPGMMSVPYSIDVGPCRASITNVTQGQGPRDARVAREAIAADAKLLMRSQGVGRGPDNAFSVLETGCLS